MDNGIVIQKMPQQIRVSNREAYRKVQVFNTLAFFSPLDRNFTFAIVLDSNNLFILFQSAGTLNDCKPATT